MLSWDKHEKSFITLEPDFPYRVFKSKAPTWDCPYLGAGLTLLVRGLVHFTSSKSYTQISLDLKQ